MISSLDNQYELLKHDSYELGAVTLLGGREDQQDCFGYVEKENGVTAILCDGMGGYSGGKIASHLAVQSIAYDIETISGAVAVNDMIGALKKAGNKVADLKDESGKPLKAGSTAVIVNISDNKLSWASVGDSRAYLIRSGEIAQLTVDHNYRTVLKEQLEAGRITLDEFKKEEVNGDALICYLGFHDLSLIDYNSSAIELFSGDYVLLVSDGVYRVISEYDILDCVSKLSDVTDVMKYIEIRILKYLENSNRGCDNSTALIIRIQ